MVAAFTTSMLIAEIFPPVFCANCLRVVALRALATICLPLTMLARTKPCASAVAILPAPRKPIFN